MILETSRPPPKMLQLVRRTPGFTHPEAESAIAEHIPEKGRFRAPGIFYQCIDLVPIFSRREAAFWPAKEPFGENIEK